VNSRDTGEGLAVMPLPLRRRLDLAKRLLIARGRR